MRTSVLSLCLVGIIAPLIVVASQHGLGKHIESPPALSIDQLNDAANGSPVYPAGGNIWPIAVYYMYINVGTPAMPYCVAIDTGSTTSAVPDVSCSSCSQNPVNYYYYNTSKSSTSVLVAAGGYGGSYETCNFADPGAECSDSGDLYTDVTGIGSASMTGYEIGSMTMVTANFDQFKVCAGIMGLFGDTLFSELVNAGQFTQNIFGMCLAATEGTQSNGTINFGGVDPQLYTGEIQYTPNTGSEYYQMTVNSATILGQTVTSIAGDAILDSGTNVLLLSQQPYTDIQTVFTNACATGSKLHGMCDVPAGATLFDGACYAFTAEQLAAWPPIQINIQNVTLQVPPQSYINLYDPLGPNPDFYCLGIRVSDAGFIIGDTIMSPYYVIFDNLNLQIGWATASDLCGNQPMPPPVKGMSGYVNPATESVAEE